MSDAIGSRLLHSRILKDPSFSKPCADVQCFDILDVSRLYPARDPGVYLFAQNSTTEFLRKANHTVGHATTNGRLRGNGSRDG